MVDIVASPPVPITNLARADQVQTHERLKEIKTRKCDDKIKEIKAVEGAFAAADYAVKYCKANQDVKIKNLSHLYECLQSIVDDPRAEYKSDKQMIAARKNLKHLLVNKKSKASYWYGKHDTETTFSPESIKKLLKKLRISVSAHDDYQRAAKKVNQELQTRAPAEQFAPAQRPRS